MVALTRVDVTSHAYCLPCFTHAQNRFLTWGSRTDFRGTVD